MMNERSIQTFTMLLYYYYLLIELNYMFFNDFYYFLIELNYMIFNNLT